VGRWRRPSDRRGQGVVKPDPAVGGPNPRRHRGCDRVRSGLETDTCLPSGRHLDSFPIVLVWRVPQSSRQELTMQLVA
jgi:hypothetical protein